MSHRAIPVAVLGGVLLAGCAGAPVEDGGTSFAESVQPHCIRDTGTRVPLPEGSCVADPGRVYTREELEVTPGLDLPDKLHTLLPQ